MRIKKLLDETYTNGLPERRGGVWTKIVSGRLVYVKPTVSSEFFFFQVIDKRTPLNRESEISKTLPPLKVPNEVDVCGILPTRRRILSPCTVSRVILREKSLKR